MPVLAYEELIEALERGDWKESDHKSVTPATDISLPAPRDKPPTDVKAGGPPAPAAMPTDLIVHRAVDPWEPPLRGRLNHRGEMVLTIQDLPELERRLRLSGWRVRRHGDELICTSPGGLTIQ